jgi:molecular chaperone GrpE
MGRDKDVKDGGSGTPGKGPASASRAEGGAGPFPSVSPSSMPDPQGGEEEVRVESDLKDLVSGLEKERDEYLELARRTKADFENYRKRLAREASEAEARGRASLARELLSVVDNLERALAAAGVEPGGEEAPAEPLAEGFFLTYRELCAALQRSGVESFDPAGERFDPTAHEALQKLPVEGVEPGTVVEVMQKGYRLGEQLIRPARVVVSE